MTEVVYNNVTCDRSTNVIKLDYVCARSKHPMLKHECTKTRIAWGIVTLSAALFISISWVRATCKSAVREITLSLLFIINIECTSPWFVLVVSASSYCLQTCAVYGDPPHVEIFHGKCTTKPVAHVWTIRTGLPGFWKPYTGVVWSLVADLSWLDAQVLKLY